VVAARALADRDHGPLRGRQPGGVVGDRNFRMEVGVAAVTNRRTAVLVDGRDVVVEVSVPAAPRIVIGETFFQPVPLQATGGQFGILDPTGEPFPAALIVGGLVPAHAGVDRDMSMLDMSGSAVRGTADDVLRAPVTRPGERGK
jgi:hypothetical protein